MDEMEHVNSKLFTFNKETSVCEYDEDIPI